jgi:hypothetical protein
MNGDTDGAVRSTAGNLGVWMGVRGFNGAEAKNQQDADDAQPASKGARLELVNREQFLSEKP